MGKSSSTPAPVDPYVAANAQQGLNTNTAEFNAALSRTGNSNALGSSSWQQNGTDPNTGAPLYNFSTQLAPQFQSLESNPINTSSVYGGGPGSPSVQQGNTQVQNALYNQQEAYLQPQQQQAGTSLNAQLAAEGATPGSEAYNNAQGNQMRSNTFANNQAANSAITGATAQQGQEQNMALQGVNAQQLAQQEPISLFNMLSGNGQTGGANSPDIMSAFNNQYQGQLNSANAQNASNNQTEGEAASLAAMYAMYAFSDKRLKSDIKKVGEMDDGPNIYTFKYKGSPKSHIGVMAQELQKSNPSAVKDFHGVKMVDYSKV